MFSCLLLKPKTNNMNCAHCNKAFTCGCQKTVAANGQTVHKSCLADYGKATGVAPAMPADGITQQVYRAKQNLRT